MVKLASTCSRLLFIMATTMTTRISSLAINPMIPIVVCTKCVRMCTSVRCTVRNTTPKTILMTTTIAMFVAITRISSIVMLESVAKITVVTIIVATTILPTIYYESECCLYRGYYECHYACEYYADYMHDVDLLL